MTRGRPLLFWISSGLAPRIASTEPNASMIFLLRRSPMPGTPSSSVRATRFARFFLFSVVANLCASSRTASRIRRPGESSVENQGLAPPGQEDLLLLLGQSDHGDRARAEAREDAFRRGELPLAAVDQDEVGPLELLVQHPGVAPRHRLTDRREIVDLAAQRCGS